MNYNFKDKRILVTGATGLIGKSLVNRLLDEGAFVIAQIRNIDKAQRVFDEDDRLSFIECDIRDFSIDNLGIDYIIHAASNTSSKAFIEAPVEVIDININGTKAVLEFARINKIKGMVYLSTMEVYGAPTTDEKINESHSTNLDSMSVRSSYPESKRMCETLCSSYASQFNVPVKVLRLTQVFGQGVEYNDNRVFAEFARCVIENRDILLHTKGETKRNYLSVNDAVDAVLTVLLKGNVGEAYNASNEDTYCSIYDMASLVADKCANGRISVIIDEDDVNRGYAPTLKMNLDSSKLRSLGWEPRIGLEDMFNTMINDMIRRKD